MRTLTPLLMVALLCACGDKDDDGDTASCEPDCGDGADGADGSSDGADGSSDGADGTGTGEGLPACSTEDGYAVALTSASVSGDTLTAVVAYSGGCETHVFSLCWPDQSFMESAPVQVNLDVLHEGPLDACDAVPSESVDFDLSPLKSSWQDAYGATSGEIVIHLSATSGAETVTYAF